MTFGNPRALAGRSYAGKSSVVPFDYLQVTKPGVPIPITISGSNNVTFTVNASVTNPVNLVNGDDFIKMVSTKAYTWTSGTNAILNATRNHGL